MLTRYCTNVAIQVIANMTALLTDLTVRPAAREGSAFLLQGQLDFLMQDQGLEIEHTAPADTDFNQILSLLTTTDQAPGVDVEALMTTDQPDNNTNPNAAWDQALLAA
jgi:hypothetical protein